MTFFLFGTITCTILFLLKQFTNVNIFEEEKTFVLSSNAISKMIKVTSKSNNNEIISKSRKSHADGNGIRNNDAANTNAKLLLDEVVTEATKVANIRNLEKNFNQVV